MQIFKIPKGPIMANMYVIETSEGSVIIDPCVSCDHLPKLKSNVIAIIATHCHFDHIAYLTEMKDFTDALFYSHIIEKDGFLNPEINGSSLFGQSVIFPFPDETVNDGDILKISDKYSLEFMHTPGHTSGSMCIILKENNTAKYVFCGDTIFKNSAGRTDLPTGNYNDLISSLEKIKKLNKSAILYSGHGEDSTIETEIKYNPYLSNL